MAESGANYFRVQGLRQEQVCGVAASRAWRNSLARAHLPRSTTVRRADLIHGLIYVNLNYRTNDDAIFRVSTEKSLTCAQLEISVSVLTLGKFFSG